MNGIVKLALFRKGQFINRLTKNIMPISGNYAHALVRLHLVLIGRYAQKIGFILLFYVRVTIYIFEQAFYSNKTNPKDKETEYISIRPV